MGSPGFRSEFFRSAPVDPRPPFLCGMSLGTRGGGTAPGNGSVPDLPERTESRTEIPSGSASVPPSLPQNARIRPRTRVRWERQEEGGRQAVVLPVRIEEDPDAPRGIRVEASPVRTVAVHRAWDPVRKDSHPSRWSVRVIEGGEGRIVSEHPSRKEALAAAEREAFR